MPATSQYNPFDTSTQIDLVNDLSSLTSLSVSGSTLTIVCVLSTHRSYAASPTTLLLSTPMQGTMTVNVGQTLTDAYGNAV